MSFWGVCFKYTFSLQDGWTWVITQGSSLWWFNPFCPRSKHRWWFAEHAWDFYTWEKFQECNKTKHQNIQWVYSCLQISTSKKQTIEVPVAGSPLRHQSFTTGFSPLHLFCPGSRSSRRWGLIIPASFEGRRDTHWSWDSWKRVVIRRNVQQDLMNGPRIEGPEWAPNLMVYMGLTNISQLEKRKIIFKIVFCSARASSQGSTLSISFSHIHGMKNRPPPSDEFSLQHGCFFTSMNCWRKSSDWKGSLQSSWVPNLVWPCTIHKKQYII